VTLRQDARFDLASEFSGNPWGLDQLVCWIKNSMDDGRVMRLGLGGKAPNPLRGEYLIPPATGKCETPFLRN
jgi:hypothetical protein